MATPSRRRPYRKPASPRAAQGAPAPGPEDAAPAAGAAAGFALAGALLFLAAVWFKLHLGWRLPEVFVLGAGTVGVLASWLPGTVSDPHKQAFMRVLARPGVRRGLFAALCVEVAFAGACSSAVVRWDGSEQGSAELRYRAGGRAHLLSDRQPVRQFGVATRPVRPFASAEYRLVEGGSFRPFLPRSYLYPHDFERRSSLILLPYDALFYAMQQEPYRVRVLRAGRAIADTVIGGDTGAGSLWVDAEPETEFEARARVILGTSSEGPVLDQQIDWWKRRRHVQPATPLRLGDSLTVEVVYAAPPGSLVMRRRIQLRDPVYIVLLYPEP